MFVNVTRAKQIANGLKVIFNFVLHDPQSTSNWRLIRAKTNALAPFDCFNLFLGFVCVYSKLPSKKRPFAKMRSTSKVLRCKHLRYVTFLWGRTQGVRTLFHIFAASRATVFPIAGREGGAMYKREAGTHHPQSNLELEGNTASSIHSGNRRHRRRCWELGQSKNNFWSLEILL